MKNDESLMIELCVLKKNVFLRVLLGLIVVLCIILLHFEAPPWLLVFFVTLPSIIGLILIQVMEKVEITGHILLNNEEIIIQQGQSKHIINYQQVKSIKIKGANIKGDVKLMKGGFFYIKKGCNNWIIIYDTNNIKYLNQILINNEIQYKMLKTKIEDINRICGVSS